MADLYIARDADIDSLMTHWSAARDGDARSVLLTAPLGGGKRAMVGELCRRAIAEEDDVLVWRVSLADEEDGLQSLLRIYAGLYQGLHRSPMLRGKVEMALNSQIPNQPRRVQGWYQAFIDGLKKGAPKPGEDKFQVIVPRDNPLVGLVEIATGIARKFPVVLALQNIHHVQSLALVAMLEALLDEMRAEGTCLLMLMSSEPLDETARTWFSNPLLDLLERRKEDLIVHELASWGEEEINRYLGSREVSCDATQLTRIAGGRPGYVAELVDWLESNDRLGEDLSTLELSAVCDPSPDEDELEEDGDAPAGGRKRAGADDAERLAYLAAVIGLSFPSGLLADLGGFDRESVDDLLDATEHIYKELQFSKPLQSWIYQFNTALLRESVLARHSTEEDLRVARNVGAFMERFLAMRGYPFLIKTLRIYARHGVAERANVIRSLALGADQPQVWAMAHDLLSYFDEHGWPDDMLRTVFMHLIDRMVGSGNLEQTEALWNRAMAWATEKEDRRLQGWLLFAGSRLDHRRQDLYRSRDRAADALKIFQAIGDKFKQGELRVHLARIELADGNPNAALDQARQAAEVSPLPPIQAHCALIRGKVLMGTRKYAEAAEQFRQANEIAGKAGVAQVALEAGLALGQALLLSREFGKCADVLRQVGQIALSLRNPGAERTASAMLSQSQAALKNFEAALKHANRTLELTRQLGFKRLEAWDLYNVALLNLQLRRATEAVGLFRQARGCADATDANLQKELLFNMGAALKEIGETAQAEEVWVASLGPSTAAKDWRKVAGANEQLSGLAEASGDNSKARQYAQAAIDAASAGNLREERKRLSKRLKAIGR